MTHQYKDGDLLPGSSGRVEWRNGDWWLKKPTTPKPPPLFLSPREFFFLLDLFADEGDASTVARIFSQTVLGDDD
jgi:hypothetical protein